MKYFAAVLLTFLCIPAKAAPFAYICSAKVSEQTLRQLVLVPTMYLWVCEYPKYEDIENEEVQKKYCAGARFIWISGGQDGFHVNGKTTESFLNRMTYYLSIEFTYSPDSQLSGKGLLKVSTSEVASSPVITLPRESSYECKPAI